MFVRKALWEGELTRSTVSFLTQHSQVRSPALLSLHTLEPEWRKKMGKPIVWQITLHSMNCCVLICHLLIYKRNYYSGKIIFWLGNSVRWLKCLKDWLMSSRDMNDGISAAAEKKNGNWDLLHDIFSFPLLNNEFSLYNDFLITWTQYVLHSILNHLQYVTVCKDLWTSLVKSIRFV